MVLATHLPPSISLMPFYWFSWVCRLTGIQVDVSQDAHKVVDGPGLSKRLHSQVWLFDKDNWRLEPMSWATDVWVSCSYRVVSGLSFSLWLLHMVSPAVAGWLIFLHGAEWFSKHSSEAALVSYDLGPDLAQYHFRLVLVKPNHAATLDLEWEETTQECENWEAQFIGHWVSLFLSQNKFLWEHLCGSIN